MSSCGMTEPIRARRWAGCAARSPTLQAVFLGRQSGQV